MPEETGTQLPEGAPGELPPPVLPYAVPGVAYAMATGVPPGYPGDAKRLADGAPGELLLAPGDALDTIGDLDSPDSSVVMKAAVTQVKVLTRAAQWHRRYIAILLVACVALIVVAGGTVYTWYQTRQGAITACQNGNKYRHDSVSTWDQFITLALQGNRDPRALATARKFSDFVARTNAPTNCKKIYGLPW